MSRSGYTCDLDYKTLNLWRGAVDSAIRGKRGQRLLIELRDSLDAMPNKELIANELVTEDGQCCALGSVAIAKGVDVRNVDPEDREHVARLFNISSALAGEILFKNDEDGRHVVASRETPTERWKRMREWTEENIAKA